MLATKRVKLPAELALSSRRLVFFAAWGYFFAMRMRFFVLCLVLALSGCVSSRVSAPDHNFQWKPAHASAQPTLLRVRLERGVDYPVYWMPHEAAQATLVHFTGRTGGFGRYDAATNTPTSQSILVRNRDLFHKAGFNVAIVGVPRDRAELTPEYRKSTEHSNDIRAILLRLKQLAPEDDLWLVGISMGTLSIANAAIGNPELIAGLVLAGGITNPKFPHNLRSLKLGNIRVPTLVLHHSKDACPNCPPAYAKDILSGLTNAPRKELIMISGGSGASGDPCRAMHHHGFINQEEEVVVRIASWIRAAY